MNDYLPSDFRAIVAATTGVDLDGQQCGQLERYAGLLHDWNRRINLTRVPPEDTWRRHFLDSLFVARAVDLRKMKSLCDLGTGGGFPGLVMKIAFPQLEVALVDSVKKKLSFLDAAIEDLGLQSVKTVHGRAEDLGRDAQHRGAYDVVTARAVAELRVLVELSLPMVKTDGYGVFLKGADSAEELDASRDAIAALGGRLSGVSECVCHGLHTTLISVAKIKATSPRYPRVPKRIAERPL